MNWYVSASGNDTTGRGTAALPYATMSKVVTLGALAPGDTIFLAGIIRDNVTFTAPVGITIRQWPGQTKYDIRGAFVASGFSASGGGYTKTLATGLTIKSVVCDWDANIDTNGLHYGHLTLAADAATALATLNNWYYNSGTGVLSINIGANPATHIIEYCIGGVGVNGITVSDADGLRILDFRASLWVDKTAASGQAIRGHGQNCLIEVDRVDDCGYHHICFADGLCNNNIIQPSKTGQGVLAGVNDGGIPLVFHTASANQTGNEARDLTIWATPLLKRDGNPLGSSFSIGGCFSHTAGGVKLDGVTWRNITIHYPYAVGVSSSPFGAGNTTAPSEANSIVGSYYGARFIECSVTGAHSQGMIVTASALYQRCRLHFSADRVGTGAIITDTGDGVAKYTHFDACEIIMYQGAGASGASEGWRQGALAGLVFLNCSVPMWGVRTAECRQFVTFASAQTIYARQSIFGYPDATAATRRLFYAEGAIAQDGAGPSYPRNFDDCGYIRITGFGYSQNASHDTPAEWLSTVDTHAQQFATNNVWEEPFTGQPMSHARLSRASGRLWTYRSVGTPHTDIGINWKPWTGTLGCEQYGAGPASSPLN